VNKIIVTGGLGPTKDDITKHTFCEYFNTKLIRNKKVEEWVEDIFKKRKLPIIDVNLMQADLPENCEVLWNRSGTAPGMWFENNNVIFASFPGVPFEMKTIFQFETNLTDMSVSELFCYFRFYFENSIPTVRFYKVK
jgi:nicotinamide-nucleotide amidase